MLNLSKKIIPNPTFYEKLLLTIITSTTLLCSCNKDDVKITDTMASINITDAKTIYEKSSGVSISTNTSTFWKIDASGNES